MRKQSTSCDEVTRSGLVRVAGWSAAHPGRAIIGWVAFVAVSLGVGAAIGSNEVSSEDFRVGEAGRAEQIAGDAGVPRPVVEQLLVTSSGGRPGPVGPEAESAAAQVADGWRALPAVAGVSVPVRSADGSAVLVTATMRGDANAAEEDLPALAARVGPVQEQHPGLALGRTGTASGGAAVEGEIGAGIGQAELITTPVTLVILVVVFGALLVAGVPMLLGLSVVASATGLYALASHLVPDVGGSVAAIMLMIGLALGVDYSLFYVTRVREERARTRGRLSDAAVVELAAATSGHTVLVSGVAVVVSLAGLYLADDVIFSSIATGTIVVVLVAMIGSVTVLPALLAALGPRVDRRSVRRAGPRPGDGRAGARWAALLRPATTRPVRTLVVSVGAMLLLALPALGITLRVEGNDTFPTSIPEVATYNRMAAAFPADGTSHLVVVRATPGRAADVRVALGDLAARSQADPLFARVAAPELTTSSDGTVSTLELPVPTGQNAEPSVHSLDVLRTSLVPATVGAGVPEAETAVSGDVARSVDYANHQSDRFLLVVGFVLLATFLMTALAFRSVVLGLLGVALNVLSAAAAFGALVAVFQNTWAEGILGFTSGGFIGSRLPLLLFVILFGLSMDYQVFVVNRIREAVAAGRPTVEAVPLGIRSSAGVVTSAAVIMVWVFASFLLVSVLELKQTGFALAVAVALDAVVIRILILPAAMTLLGERCWWPSRPRPPVVPADRPDRVPVRSD